MMGADSKIEWCDHTFNPWVGCAKISPACANCYAEGWAKRTGQAGLWRGERRRTSAANWREPLKWNKKTPGARVFCSSLADVFEAGDELDDWRMDLFDLISRTPDLTWLLLTKRPENAARWFRHPDMMLPNVWIGATVEDQQRADERIPHLLRVPAAVRFLSCEPLLGPVALEGLRDAGCGAEGCDGTQTDALGGLNLCGHGYQANRPTVSWVIAGGESGPKARPTHPDWFRALRDQCRAADVPFFFKQWGEWAPEETSGRPEGARLLRVGKRAAGRLLDGQEWSQFPGREP